MMTDFHLGDPVYEYVLEKEENLRLAALVAETWPRARADIARQFLGEIERHLRMKIQKETDWSIESYGYEIYEKQWLQPVYLTKAGWNSTFFISMELQQRGKKCVTGIWRERKKEAALDGKLAQALKNAGIQHRTNQWWACQIDAEVEVSNWREGETLCHLKFQSKQWSRAFAEALWRLANLAGTVIDKHYKPKQG